MSSPLKRATLPNGASVVNLNYNETSDIVPLVKLRATTRLDIAAKEARLLTFRSLGTTEKKSASSAVQKRADE